MSLKKFFEAKSLVPFAEIMGPAVGGVAGVGGKLSVKPSTAEDCASLLMQDAAWDLLDEFCENVSADTDYVSTDKETLVALLNRAKMHNKSGMVVNAADGSQMILVKPR